MKNYLQNTVKIIASSLIGLLVISFVFMLVEPSISMGAQTVISQTVNKEISFVTPASNITLSPSIDSVVGGMASGTTQVVIVTNDHLGYMMTIMASSSVGMVGNASSTNSIPAYVTAVAGVPDFTFTAPANKAYFGYTVEASTTADLADSFKDATGSCDASGGGDTTNACWISATSTAYTIVNRTSATAVSGATTTLKFLVVINANPSPRIPDDTYVATTTLTATAN